MRRKDYNKDLQKLVVYSNQQALAALTLKEQTQLKAEGFEFVKDSTMRDPDKSDRMKRWRE